MNLTLPMASSSDAGGVQSAGIYGADGVERDKAYWGGVWVA